MADDQFTILHDKPTTTYHQGPTININDQSSTINYQQKLIDQSHVRRKAGHSGGIDRATFTTTPSNSALILMREPIVQVVRVPSVRTPVNRDNSDNTQTTPWKGAGGHNSMLRKKARAVLAVEVLTAPSSIVALLHPFRSWLW